MVKQNNKFFAGIISTLMVLFLVTALNNCSPRAEENEVEQAAEIIREYALRKNPALKGKRLRVNMSIDGGVNSADVCACIQVCDSRGQNCTGCSCSPANCGTCD